MPYLSTAIVELSDAARYMKQLCRHFAHKVESTFDDTTGNTAFPGAPGTFIVQSQTQLRVELRSEERDLIDRFQGTVDRHLKKFAFREEFELVWTTEEVAAEAVTQ